jgi:hypothetical protein
MAIKMKYKQPDGAITKFMFSAIQELEHTQNRTFTKTEIKNLSIEDKQALIMIKTQTQATILGLTEMLKNKSISKQEYVDILNNTMQVYSFSLEDFKQTIEDSKIAKYYAKNDYSTTYIR